MGKSVLTN